MGRRFLSITLFIMVIASAQCNAIAMIQINSYPRLFFRYVPFASVDNIMCPRASEITSVWMSEMTSLLPQLQNEWDKQAPALLDIVLKLTGRPFQRKEETITIFLCKSLHAQGVPLMMMGYPFLKSAMQNKPFPLWRIGPAVFHELMHLYVMERIDYFHPTPLLKKYAKENAAVLTHIHVMALQKLVYDQIDPSGVLTKTISDSEIAGGKEPYRRSWEIVSDSKIAQALVDELK